MILYYNDYSKSNKHLEREQKQMKLSKINSNGYKIYMEEYNSISEFVQTINSRPQNQEIKSKQSETGNYSFTGTNDYNEAEN